MASTYRQVGYGSTGSAVTKLQTTLNEHGYDLDVDGIFGEKTQAAVRDYQEKYGLKLDGIAGKETWGSLLAQDSGSDGVQGGYPGNVRSSAGSSGSSGIVPTGTVSSTTAAALKQLEQGYAPSDAALAAKKNADTLAGQKPKGR